MTPEEFNTPPAETAPRANGGGSSSPRGGKGFAGSTVSGILGAVALMGAAVWMSGSLSAFFDPPSVLIVLGGTILLSAASFTWADLAHAAADVRKILFSRRGDASKIAFDVLRIAEFARRRGIFSLQGSILNSLKSDLLLHKGLQLTIDGLNAAEIEQMLRQEMLSQRTRSAKSIGVLRRAAEIAPAMGLIGTLIGLVQMLGRLSDPASIGSGMAIALLTTFYGACLANVVFAPLASKLERNAHEEAIVQRIHLLAVLSMERQDNPRRLEMQINSVLPPDGKIQFFN